MTKLASHKDKILFALDDLKFRETIESFVETEIRPYAFEWDEAGHVPWALHEQIGALGIWGFGIDETYGGLGFDDPFMRMDCAVALSMCGAGGVPAALGGRGISLDPIQKLAHEDIRMRVLPEVISGRKGSSLGITEPGGGSDVANLKTTAVKDGDDWVLNGSKAFITGGMESDYFVIGARTGGPGLASSHSSEKSHGPRKLRLHPNHAKFQL